MSVRRARLQDVPRLVRLAQIEHARSRFASERFDPVLVARNFEHAVTGLVTAVFISDTELGFIGGMAQPNLFNGRAVAYELAWYAEDGSGLALLRALTQWARSVRATDLVVHHYSGIQDDKRFARVMRRRGFAELGATFNLHLLEN